MSLAWTTLWSRDTTAEALGVLNTANDWQSFNQALWMWQAPVLNFVYADVNGNIGYYMAGTIPIRYGSNDTVWPLLGD